MYRIDDYRKSGLPMLPVTHGKQYTSLQVLLYSLMLLAACLLPYVYGMSGLLYLLVAVPLCLVFIVYACRLWRDSANDRLALRTFVYSILHLSLLFVVLLVDHYMALI